MFRKGSKLYSISRFNCPHCHEGEFFVDRNPYHLSTAGDILERCPACGRKYGSEPGFYYGGMYVAYGLSVALFVSVYLASLVLLPEASTGMRVGLVLASLVLLGPWLYALSKIIWANLFFTFKAGSEEPGQEQA